VSRKNVAARGRITGLSLVLGTGAALLVWLEGGIGACANLGSVGHKSERLGRGIIRVERRQSGRTRRVADQPNRGHQGTCDEATLDHRSTRNLTLHVEVLSVENRDRYSRAFHAAILLNK